MSASITSMWLLGVGVRRFVIRGMKKTPETGGFLQRWTKSFRQAMDWLLSVPMAILPSEKNENCDQSGGDEHPVLAFKAQKRKMPDQKLHRSRPRFWAE
jgi:hypothetical protein